MKRVQTASGNLMDTALVETRSDVGMFSDVVVLVRERGGPARFRFGRIARTRRGGKRGKVEYTRPVPVHSSEYGVLEIILNMYVEKTKTAKRKSNIADDGRKVTLVTPEINPSNTRKSKRTRKCVTLDTI